MALAGESEFAFLLFNNHLADLLCLIGISRWKWIGVIKSEVRVSF